MIDRGVDSATRTRVGDRGVSEVVAFILVFAIILGSVGLLYSTAFGAMTDYQETEQQINAERAMESLADNFNDVIRNNGVNQRYGELALREGTVTTSDDGTEINISVDGDPISDDEVFDYVGDTLNLGTFSYTHEGNTIAYEGGGLVRGDESSDWSMFSKQPYLKCNEEGAAVISLVQITADDRSISSSSGLGFTMSVENRSSKVYEADNVTVAFEDGSAYEDAWNETLDSGDWNGDDTAPEGTCDGLERAVITIVEVDIQY